LIPPPPPLSGFTFPLLIPRIGIKALFFVNEIFIALRKDLEDGILQVEKD
jgi:hypothetical protein